MSTDDVQHLSTVECNDLAIPSVCLYLFPLCGSDGREYLPSQELCLEISLVVCQRLWTIAENLGFGDQLPVCADLPIASMNECARCLFVVATSLPLIFPHFFLYHHLHLTSLPCFPFLVSSDETRNATVGPSSPANVSCSFGFFEENGICLPDCYTYVSTPRNLAATNQLIVGVAIVFGLVFSVMVFILSFVRRRVM